MYTRHQNKNTEAGGVVAKCASVPPMDLLQPIYSFEAQGCGQLLQEIILDGLRYSSDDESGRTAIWKYQVKNAAEERVEVNQTRQKVSPDQLQEPTNASGTWVWGGKQAAEKLAHTWRFPEAPRHIETPGISCWEEWLMLFVWVIWLVWN